MSYSTSNANDVTRYVLDRIKEALRYNCDVPGTPPVHYAVETQCARIETVFLRYIVDYTRAGGGNYIIEELSNTPQICVQSAPEKHCKEIATIYRICHIYNDYLDQLFMGFALTFITRDRFVQDYYQPRAPMYGLFQTTEEGNWCTRVFPSIFYPAFSSDSHVNASYALDIPGTQQKLERVKSTYEDVKYELLTLRFSGLNKGRKEQTAMHYYVNMKLLELVALAFEFVIGGLVLPSSILMRTAAQNLLSTSVMLGKTVSDITDYNFFL